MFKTLTFGARTPRSVGRRNMADSHHFLLFFCSQVIQVLIDGCGSKFKGKHESVVIHIYMHGPTLPIFDLSHYD